jgi:hypothetical protein
VSFESYIRRQPSERDEGTPLLTLDEWFQFHYDELIAQGASEEDAYHDASDLADQDFAIQEEERRSGKQ